MLLSIILLTTFAFGTASQASRVPTVNELLTKHGIALSEPALIQALNNADSEVRVLAATKLAGDHDTNAISAIEKAVGDESNDVTRVQLARALAELGDEKGLSVLRAICSSEKNAGAIRVMAVQNLLELGHRECIDPVLSLIRSNRNDAEDRAVALTLLPQFIASPALTSKEALDVDIKCLNDPSALVRLTAARVLGDLGDQQNMSALESAIAREPEQTYVRKWSKYLLS
jgi:hypothetical protein